MGPCQHQQAHLRFDRFPPSKPNLRVQGCTRYRQSPQPHPENRDSVQKQGETDLNTIVPLGGIEQCGVLLREADRYVFCYGPHNASNGVYVLRIGGHREPGESAWESAAREAREEASAVVRQIPSEVSVQTIGGRGVDCTITTLSQPAVLEEYPDERPLVVGRLSASSPIMSTLFLAETDDESRPSNEVFGLVKLTGEEVIEVARGKSTFSEIQATAEPQRTDVEVTGETTIVLSTHLRALAYCLERGYV
jgi:8-oxo-dGTP pyrophosphatase MutT (NUDIX family)